MEHAHFACTVYGRTLSSTLANGRIILAEVAPAMTEGERIANARLIAAAPALLEACQRIIAAWDDAFDGEGPDTDGRYRCSSSVLHDDLERARAAIAAAAGTTR